VANEYRIYHVSTEALHSGDPLGAVRFYGLAAELIHTGLATNPVQIYHISLEVIRDLRDKYSLAFTDDPDTVHSGFIFQGAFGWTTVETEYGAEVFAPRFITAPVTVIEWNPYRPDIPHQIAESDPTLYDYLREQAEILREQHDRLQAGGTTFPWQLAVQTSDTAKFELGALSRFYHPDYGILLARYVRFSRRWTAGLHMPVGRDLKFNDWVVTNQIELSHWTQLIGVSLAYESELANRYGWVLVQGRGIVPLRVNGVQPEQFDALTWTGFGIAGLGAGKILGYPLGIPIVVASSQYAYSIGDWTCDVSGVTAEYIQQLTETDFDEVDARLDAVELALQTQVIDYQPQIDAITADVASLQTRLGFESQQRSQTDQGFQQRIQALESSSASGVSTGEFTLLADRVTALEDILGARVTTLEGAVTTLAAASADHTTRITSLETASSGLLSSLTSISNAACLSPLDDYLDDTAAAAGGVPINGFYRNGSVVMIRVV
jgi:hypothetical protein